MNEDQFWNLLAKKLSGEASPREVEELASLIKANPELSFTAQHITEVWKLKHPTDKTQAEEAFKNHLKRLEGVSLAESAETGAALSQPSSKKGWITSSLFLLAIATLSVIAISLLRNAKAVDKAITSNQTEEIFTRPGTRTKIVLPDSTTVWLNAGSKLSYSKPFGVNDRVVTLNGEAFFDVTKSSKPFIILTSGVRVKVLGTVFNVRSYEGEKKFETSLLSGRVEITLDKNPEKKYVLRPNEKLTLNTQEADAEHSKVKTSIPLAVVSTLYYIDSNTIAETSWVENKLVFADESFEDISRKMERWYGTKIIINDERLKQERFTGVFEKESVWEALEAMQMITPFRFSMKNNEIIITH